MDRKLKKTLKQLPEENIGEHLHGFVLGKYFWDMVIKDKWCCSIYNICYCKGNNQSDKTTFGMGVF